MFSARTGGPGKGLFPTNLDVRVVNRSGGSLAIGDVVKFELDSNETETTTFVPGSDASAFSNVTDPDTSQDVFIACVALEVIADNASGMARVQGVVTCNVGATTVAGSKLITTHASNRLAVSTGGVGGRVVGIALEADASNLATCLFDGVHGFGNDTLT